MRFPGHGSIFVWILTALPAIAQEAGGSSANPDNAAELAKKLNNPVASLISVPFQGNWNGGIGPDGEGSQWYVNLQPVIPFALNEDWNIISRTIVPVIYQDEIFPGAGSQFGLGNTLQSLFLSPQEVVNGFTWGVGPAFYLPTNTDDRLGPDTWGAGPTAVGLWQGHGWTIGALGNHIWSFAGSDDAPTINATFLEPFIAYTTRDAWSLTVDTESTYDWVAKEWSVPVNVTVSKVVKVGDLPVSLFGGVRYWASTPEETGPDGWGARAGVTFLFPR
jgi:hypothetical protein